MMTETTVRDACDDLTVLYYKGCPQGFKFFGDDPEEHKSYINDTHIDMIKDISKDYPWEFLSRFYLHSRCLLFTSGVWMSETSSYSQYLRYRSGANTSFRVSGMTRFTALTNNSSAICVGYNPDADHILNLRREVHEIKDKTHFMPLSTSSILVPTENCTYGDLKIDLGHPVLAKHEFDELVFEKPGYLIEFMNEPMYLEEELVNYCHQYISQDIEVFQR